MPRKKVISFCSLLLLLLLFARHSSAGVCTHTTASFNKKACVLVATHGPRGSIDGIDLPVPTTVLGVIINHHFGNRNHLQGDLRDACIRSTECTHAHLTRYTQQALQFHTPTQRLLLFPKHWFW